MIGWCYNPEADAVTLVLFNPNPNISLPAVCYNNSHLVVFDPVSQELIRAVKTGNGHQSAASLASSPDGRTLASVDCLGSLQIWNIEPLTLLYQVSSSHLGFIGLRDVAFGSNGLRVFDLTISKLRVWEPVVWIRKTTEEDVGVSDAAFPKAIQGQGEPAVREEITAMVIHPILPVTFVGKCDESVVIYSPKTGEEDATL